MSFVTLNDARGPFWVKLEDLDFREVVVRDSIDSMVWWCFWWGVEVLEINGKVWFVIFCFFLDVTVNCDKKKRD